MLARDIVNGALRKLGRLGGGREPRLADQQDTLSALVGLYRSMIASGAFGRVHDLIATGATYTATPNTRIYRREEEVGQIVLPSVVDRGWWGVWDCWDRSFNSHVYDDLVLDVNYVAPACGITTPRDGSVVIINDACSGLTRDFLYDGATQKWQMIDGMALDAEAPRSHADPQGLMAVLAMEVADQFGADLSPMILQQAARYKTAAISRFGMERQPTAGVYM